jgi:acetyl-CoA carboxylase biotin carboxyl carrier protein
MTYQILAPMAGTIARVDVVEGDTVSEMAVLLIMESMKMEVPVEATFAGQVKKIHCAVGDLVDMDQLLIVLA